MRALLALVISVLFITTSSAQMNKGQVYISGDFNAWYDNSEGTYWFDSETRTSEALSIGVHPAIGWFVNDKISLELGGGYDYNYDYLLDRSEEIESILYGYEVFLRLNHFVPVIKKKIGYAGAAKLFYNWSLTELYADDGTDVSDLDITTNRFGLAYMPGVYAQVSKRIWLAGSFGELSYSYYDFTERDNLTLSATTDFDGSGNEISLNFDPSVWNLGIRYVIN